MRHIAGEPDDPWHNPQWWPRSVPFPIAQVVRLAFGQRRKKLANALKSLEVGELLKELGLVNLRAEEVPVAGYLEIVRKLVP